jgi:hypothetical protein
VATVRPKCTEHTPLRCLLYGNIAQSILKDLGGDLHGTYLASAGAALLGQTRKPVSGGVAHRHLGMPHPACIGWPAWTETLPRLKAGLYGCDDLGQPCSTERSGGQKQSLPPSANAGPAWNCPSGPTGDLDQALDRPGSIVKPMKYRGASAYRRGIDRHCNAMRFRVSGSCIRSFYESP